MTDVSPSFEPILTTGLNTISPSHFSKYFLHTNCPMKIKVSQAQSNKLFLRRHQIIKNECTDLRYEEGLLSLTAAKHGVAVRVLSAVFIVAQIDTRNMEYLICWLQKISLEQLLFD